MPASFARRPGCDHPCGAHDRAVPLFATAPPNARRWLLIEYPGPWPDLRTGLDRLPTPVVRAFRRAEALGVRAQLMRRPGSRRAGGEFWVLACRSEGGDPWLSAVTLKGWDELDALDMDRLARGARIGTPVAGPAFLVCTNARRNACCSRLGLPLARSLTARFPGRVWETSHVGGDAHAPNLVCLPHGLYYGALSADAAALAASSYAYGTVVLDGFRGRAGLPRASQAAEHFVREHTGELSVNLVSVVTRSETGATTEALVSSGADWWRVVVDRYQEPAACCADCPDRVGHRLTALGATTAPTS